MLCTEAGGRPSRGSAVTCNDCGLIHQIDPLTPATNPRFLQHADFVADFCYNINNAFKVPH